MVEGRWMLLKRGSHAWLWAIMARLTHKDPLLPIPPTFREKNISSDFNMNFSDVQILKMKTTKNFMC